MKPNEQVVSVAHLEGQYPMHGRKGFLCRSDLHDWGPIAVREIFEENVYRVDVHRMFEHSRTVVDIGANIGVFSVYCAWHGCDVWAVEPDPDNHYYLQQNIADNLVKDQVRVCNAAVWKESGTVHMVCGEQASRVTETGWPIRVECPGEPIEIPAITLAEAVEPIEGDIALLKMDCEAAEYDIFESTDEEIIKRFDNITMEFHGVRVGTEEERFGGLVTKLARTHAVQTLGHPYRGGQIYAKRY